MIGLECPNPGIGVFHLMFSEVVTSHLVGVLNPSAMPLAWGPRNEGQCTPSGSAADPLRFTPGQPRRTDSHGNAYLRCLSLDELGILGALSKHVKDLLRPAAAGIPCGSEYF